MALSLEARDIVNVAKGLFEDPDGNSRNKIDYIVEFEDTRRNHTSRVAQLRFTLKKPIDEDELDKQLENLFPRIAEVLENDAAAYVGTKILANQGFTRRHISASSRRSIVDVAFFDDVSDEVTQGVNVGVQPARGKLLSRLNLKAALELVMKENMLKIMTGPNAGMRGGPLKNRTGRFINTSQVADAVITNAGAKRPNMSIYYRYMIYPYQVFDPKNTKSPQKNLASYARNPQRIIGESLAKAAKTILGDNYKLTIRQVL
ncbi:hypothetical protein [Vibrio phage VCPH]|nr:hypothetical protein [Vibrio phage VCPH]